MDKLSKEDTHLLLCSVNVMKILKSTRMRDVYQHAWGGEKYVKNVIGKPEKRYLSVEVDIDGRLII